MFKYIGDSIINASFTVQVPKPLDSRTVVNNITELYSIPSTYAYLGMTVANIDNGNIYMLVDKSKIDQKAGWKASYESIQIITCSYQEYKEWELNTNELFQPIDSSKEYLHLDIYYYIYEDSLPLEDINQEYVKRSDWLELLNQVSTKASNDAVIAINQTLALIVNDYATKLFVTDSYAPLSMFDLNNTESFIITNFFTKEEALGKFVKFSDLSGKDPGEGDYIFVTTSKYQTDQEALKQYKQGIANELANCLKVGDNGELDSITIGQIKSKKINNEQLIIDVAPQGMSIGGDPIAKLSDVPAIKMVSLDKFEELTKDPNVYYFVYNTNQDLAFVTAEELKNYYTKPQIDNKILSAVKDHSYKYINEHIDFSTVLVLLAIKNTVEKISMERIADNQYYQSRVCGNHIDITEFAPDQSVLTTAGTGLISFIRHLITNDTQLGNDLITVTLSYNGNKVVMNESGSSSDNPSTVSVQMLTFFRQITGISSGDIKQSDLFGMIIDMAVNLDNVIVNYKIAIKSA